MNTYDPENAPDPAEWLALDEQERIMLVEEFHREKGIEVPSLTTHAVIHSVIENQIAEGHTPVVGAMERLDSAGLSRHESLHAVGSVLAEHLFEVLQDSSRETDLMAAYDAALDNLTAQSWLRG